MSQTNYAQAVAIDLAAVTAQTISSETVSIPAGAAGTVVNFYLAKKPIADANGGWIGVDGDSSVSLTSTAFTNEVPYGTPDDELANGDYYVDYVTGKCRGKKADTSTSQTADYITFSKGLPSSGTMASLTVDDLTVNNQFTFANLAAGNMFVEGQLLLEKTGSAISMAVDMTNGSTLGVLAGLSAGAIQYETGKGMRILQSTKANIRNGVGVGTIVFEIGEGNGAKFRNTDFTLEGPGNVNSFFFNESTGDITLNAPLTVQGADAQIFEVLTSTGTRVFSVDTAGPANVVVENIDFRVDTDNITDAFFIDESEDTISIGDINGDQNGSYFQVVDGDAVTPGQSAFIFNGGQNAATGAVLKLQNLTPTPAPNTNLAGWQAIGLDDGGNQTIYAAMGSGVVDDTDGSESASINLLTLDGSGNPLSPRFNIVGNSITIGATAGDTVFIRTPNLQATAVTPDTTTVAAYQYAESSIGSGTYRPLFAGTSTGNIPDGEANYPINGLIGVSTGADKGLYINYGSTSSAEYRRIQVEGQGADVASAANLSITSPYTAFEVTGTTNIDFITTAGVNNGRIITLVFAGSLDVNHNQSPVPGGSAAIITKTGAAVSMTTGSTIRLQLLEQGGTQRWYEI